MAERVEIRMMMLRVLRVLRRTLSAGNIAAISIVKGVKGVKSHRAYTRESMYLIHHHKNILFIPTIKRPPFTPLTPLTDVINKRVWSVKGMVLLLSTPFTSVLPASASILSQAKKVLPSRFQRGYGEARGLRGLGMLGMASQGCCDWVVLGHVKTSQVAA